MPRRSVVAEGELDGEGLPQCADDRMVSPQEAERFAQSPGGFFPRPQYALDAQQVLAGGKGGVVLLVR